jgi:hypothetical protein
MAYVIFLWLFRALLILIYLPLCPVMPRTLAGMHRLRSIALGLWSERPVRRGRLDLLKKRAGDSN